MLPQLTASAIALIVLTGCRTAIAPKLNKFYGGNAGLIQTTTECDLFRIDPNRTKRRDVKTMYSHELLDGPILVARKPDRQIRKALLDISTYQLEPRAVVKLCTFEPCCILRYGKLDVLVSFACSRVAAYHGGKFLGMRDIEPGHNHLLKLMKPLFSDDPYFKLLEPIAKKKR